MKHEKFNRGDIRDDLTEVMVRGLNLAPTSVDIADPSEAADYLIREIGIRPLSVDQRIDAAIDMALHGSTGLPGAVGEMAAATILGAVWLAWYVVLCPPVSA